jgi:predicted RNA-binding Zn-ribbon protein involved in translation (DUF1610 family)
MAEQVIVECVGCGKDIVRHRNTTNRACPTCLIDSPTRFDAEGKLKPEA